MSIANKIIGGFVVILLLLLSLAAISLFIINKTHNDYARFHDVNERLMESANALQANLYAYRTHYRGLLLYPSLFEEIQQNLQQNEAEARRILESIRNKLDSKEGLRFVSDMLEQRTLLEQKRQLITKLLREHKRDEAIALGIRDIRPLNIRLINKVKSFYKWQSQLLQDERNELEQNMARFKTTILAVALLTLCAGGLFSYYLSRSITQQLNEGANQLATASAQILATTMQVASGATETATAVSETTATVEEVKQTAQIASQKARYVSDSAQQVKHSAQKGHKAVEETIQGMHVIQEQMETIAETIVRLSEQNQAIGEIIATVNDLSEQSNLLAVNAAIEAAKAGEKGKGFAVVAQEVRSLAEQSKQATSQVRLILGDIQKATNTAVLATEQGGKAVKQGVGQAAETSHVIEDLSDSISNAAQAATQIAASSQQQMVGMDQVALAMENIKQASEQNMAGTKQAETAAHNLHELGIKLNLLIKGKST